MDDDDTLRGRVTRQGEEAIGRLAQELLENPVVSRGLTAAFETRERAMRAQELAMGALNLPSAADLERLTRRVRSVSQRLEGIEDGLDRLDERLQRSGSSHALEDRLTKIEALLERLESAPAAGGAKSAPARAPRSTAARSHARKKPASGS
jgi:predicted  nucleic acid-binding Zn-ribbon protein